MSRKEFSALRRKLNKTQLEMSRLLGVSLSAIHGYEQGWRVVPVHVERQIYFLVSLKDGDDRHHTNGKKPCWIVHRCGQERKESCPAWEFHAGDLCWFINGTICQGDACSDWSEKMKYCRKCEVFRRITGQRRS